MAKGSTERESLDRLFAMSNQLLNAPGTASDEVTELLDAIHAADADEKEKLKLKDQLLVNGIAAGRRDIDSQDHLPQGTARAFRGILNLLIVVEAILWELKKLPGEMPKPQPPPPPQPPQPKPPQPLPHLRV